MDVFSSVLEIPKEIGYWLVRADGGKYYEDFFLNNFIAVSDNEITLEKVSNYNKGSLVGITTDDFKDLYSIEYKGWSSQQIAHAVSRTQKFIVEMKIGDLILVPSRNSKNFLIGIITSDVFEITEEEVTSKVEVNYAINPFFKRRKVQWLKEISRSEISEKLYWILSAHQTIFNLEDNKENINQLLAPIYIQDGLCHGSLKVSKMEGLDSDEWYDFYSIIKKESTFSKEKVIVKSNVQSPGIIEVITQLIDSPTAMSIMGVLGGLTFTDVKFGDKTIRGVIPYFANLKLEKEKMKQENKRIEIDNRKAEKEIEILDEEIRSKKLDNDKKTLELEKEKLAIEVQQLRQQLQIASFDAGRVFEDQTQMDNLDDQDADEF